MGRCLIVANQTLGGIELDRSARDCIARDVREFYVLVPTTRVKHELLAWTGGFGVYEGMTTEDINAVRERATRDREAAIAEARRRAQERLDQMIKSIEAAGGQAEGEVGVADPYEATKTVLARQDAFDEIIVSTLPAGLSRWVKLDVPHRIGRLADVPVTRVEAEPEPR